VTSNSRHSCHFSQPNVIARHKTVFFAVASYYVVHNVQKTRYFQEQNNEANWTMENKCQVNFVNNTKHRKNTFIPWKSQKSQMHSTASTNKMNEK